MVSCRNVFLDMEDYSCLVEVGGHSVKICEFPSLLAIVIKLMGFVNYVEHLLTQAPEMTELASAVHISVLPQASCIVCSAVYYL